MLSRLHNNVSQLLAKPICGCAPLVFFAALTVLTLLSAPAVTTTLAAPPQEQTQSPAPKEDAHPVTLEPGKPLERELKGGEKHTYEIRAASGQFLHAEVEQLGIDVALTLYAPDGKPIASMDSPNGTFGPEKISTIADSPGIYHLEVASDDKNAPAARYRVTVSISGKVTDADRSRIAAEKLFADATQLQARGTPEALQAAVEKFEATLPLWQQTGDLYEQAVSQEALATIWTAQHKQAEARKAYESVIDLWHKQDKPDLEASSLRYLGLLYYYTGAMKSALECFERALFLDRSVGNKGGEGMSLSDLGEVYQDLGEKQKALAYFQQALPLVMERGTTDNQGSILNNLGGIYDDLGEYPKSLDYYLQALPKAREAGNRAGESTILQNVGLLYAKLNQPRKAITYYEQSIPLARAARDKRREAMTLNGMGAAHAALGQIQKAIENYQAALELQLSVGDKAGAADSLNNLGVVYGDLGQPERALEYFKQALPIQQDAGLKPKEGISLINIAEIYFTKEDPAKAIEYYDQAIDLLKQSNDRYGEGMCLEGIANAYDALGNIEKSIEIHKQSLALFQEINSRLGEATARDNLAFIWAKQGKLDDARTYSGQAALLYHEVDNPLEEGVALSKLMEENAKAEDDEAAVFFGKEAIDKFQEIRRNIRGLEKETRRSFVKKRETSYRILADLLIRSGRLGEAQQVLDLLKDQEYFEFIRRDERQAASLTAPVELTMKEKELNVKYAENAASAAALGNERAALLAKSSRTPEEDKRLSVLADQLRAANQAWKRFLDDLSLELRKSKQPQTTVENLLENVGALQHVLRQLGAGTVAIYTLISEEDYRVFVVTPSVRIAREYPIKVADLSAKVAAFRNALLDPASDPVPKAQDLYKILVGPIAKDLEGAQATTLMWSLDGVLRYLPISALHDGHQYLVEKYRNIVFTPTSVPALAAPATVSEWHGLGMGVSKSYGGMDALPTVPAELHAIIRETGTAESLGVMPGHTLLDDSFTEDNLKKALSQKYPLVHIASHFVFGPGNDTDSYLLLGGKEAAGQRLTLAEIDDDIDISFNDVELLTLSACNTALSIPGDGREVDGLGILAQRKGAKAVMATLWSVYDPSTSLLMQNFYRHWTTGTPLSKAEALRQAQLTFLHGPADAPTSAAEPPYSHPYYWAPFILIGNWQ